MTHEVRVLCNCNNVEQCRTEVYVSDVRIAYDVIRVLMAVLRQGQSDEQSQPKLVLVA